MMNGRTDSAEYFYQSDFQTVLNFAESNGMSRYTFWSANRDRQCNPPDNNGSLSGTCSSVPQSDWDFTKIVVQFVNGSSGGTTPTPTPTTGGTTPTPTPTATSGGSCAGVSAWNSTTAYVGGNKVTYNGELWQAKWWTEADVPGGAAGVWTLLGPC